MKHSLVIGSGISGLTAALLQAQRGRHVVLVEKQPFIGGFLNRFTRNGLRFDTGLHFTGGFGHVLSKMLEQLNMADAVKPAPIASDVLLADSGLRLNLPNAGLETAREALARQFPAQADAIAAYYAAEQTVVEHTPIFNLDAFEPGDVFSMLTDYDALTVDELLDSLDIRTPELRTILPIFSVCHGSPPDTTPFPYHCRCAYNMEANLTAVAHGGDAFIAAFKRELARHGVQIRTGTTVECLRFDETAGTCNGATLSNGENFEVESLHFAVHPAAFMPLFPDGLLPPRLRRRVQKLRPTCSFFTIYGYLDDGAATENRLTFYMRRTELNGPLHPGRQNYSTGIVTSVDNGNTHPTVTAFRTMFTEDFEKFCGVPYEGYRQAAAYRQAKQELAASLEADVLAAYPAYRGKFHLVDAGSPYTCRRFSPPIGSAYGTQQPMAVSRVVGRLPVPNFYAIGHHAQFPGVLGCMLGAFVQTLLNNS